jgi:hypothetical protein
MGNKGGVAAAFRIGSTSLLFINAHLAAHQNGTAIDLLKSFTHTGSAVRRRNTDAIKILRGLAKAFAQSKGQDWRIRTHKIAPSDDFSESKCISPTGPASSPASGNLKSLILLSPSSTKSAPLSPLTLRLTGALGSPAGSPKTKPSMNECFDRVVFAGDLNYRIRGNREIVDKLIHKGMHEVLVQNDQLKWSQRERLVFPDFVEGPLNFKPTYKLDKDSDRYDTGPKRRIPAWTDRVLYKPDGVTLIEYNSDPSLKTSDHRYDFARLCLSLHKWVQACVLYISHGRDCRRFRGAWIEQPYVCYEKRGMFNHVG